jgi:hypothetical protein
MVGDRGVTIMAKQIERPAVTGKNRIRIEVRRRKREFLEMFREFARNADEAGFKTYLIEDCGKEPGDAEYPAAMREFWNLVRAIENERRR